MELHIEEYRAHASLEPQTPVFEIRTCQRTLKISARPLEIEGSPRRRFSGAEAYEFLLRFASGLESEIKGETDVFGQVKTAFRDFSTAHPERAGELHSVFQTLFEDTKEIRAQYLQGIGGNTYGALARRVLDPQPSNRVLLLGAGQIAKSVAPYFADAGLTVFNRSPERLMELQVSLHQKGYSGVTILASDADLPSEISSANIILLATPVGSPLDSLVLSHRNSRTRVLHLGGRSEDLNLPENEPNLFTLSDLFALEKEQSSLREKKIAQAMEACRQRALLRSLARSIHIHHGWEDLAYFN
jgi:glutamyl-tRNA reductase